MSTEPLPSNRSRLAYLYGSTRDRLIGIGKSMQTFLDRHL